MKKRFAYTPLVLLLLSPAAVLIGAVIGYEWVLASDRGFAAVFALLFCAAVRYLPKSEVPAPVGLLSLPLALVNLYIWLVKGQDWLVILLFAVCAVAALKLLKSERLVKGQRIAAAVVSLLLFVPYLLLLPIAAFGFAMGETETVAVVHSPEGTYRAELLDVDQGALGGDTVVNVYNEDHALDFGFVQLREKPQRVYMGPWGEFEDMELEWSSDTVLRIDGVDYEMED